MGKFTLRIGFVDSSYWDDGNRSTCTKKEFDSIEEVDKFLAAHLGKPYTFRGQEGDVVSSIDPERLQLTEVTTTQHDWRSLPCMKPLAEEKFREEMRNIVKWGGNLADVEKQVLKCIGWSRERFLAEWRAIVTTAKVELK